MLASAASRLRTFLWCRTTHTILLEKRPFRRDAETNTRDACATRSLYFLPASMRAIRQVAPPANNVFVTLPRLVIRRDCAARSDREKIVSFRKGVVVPGFRRAQSFSPNHAPSMFAARHRCSRRAPLQRPRGQSAADTQ